MGVVVVVVVVVGRAWEKEVVGVQVRLRVHGLQHGARQYSGSLLRVACKM